MQCAVKIFCSITVYFYKILLDLVLTMNAELKQRKMRTCRLLESNNQNCSYGEKNR